MDFVRPPGGRGAKQNGQAIVIVALMLTVLVGMVAIAIDGARAYALRRELQGAVDTAALAAADKYQQTGSYATAEQAATTIFGSNVRLYGAPACGGYGSPGAAPWTVTCTFSDGTVLTDVARATGSQGSKFTLTATRNVQLQFGRLLTNGTSPTLGATSNGEVNSLRFTPTIAALNQSGCGGSGGTAITVNGAGSLSITGDIVANGSVTVAAGGLAVAGDLFARCQSTVAGAVSNLCYPSGASTPCSYPDIAGATRSGFRLADPRYPAPTNLGSAEALPVGLVAQPGIYAAPIFISGGHCWFLAGGVYTFQAGVVNTGDLVSNELKPPDEPNPSDVTMRAANQFWNSAGVNCSGTFELDKQTGAVDIPSGNWSFEITSVRSDTYNGVTYTRESAPSMCRSINVNSHFDNVSLSISNVPGATSYNIYASPPPGTCTGPFGLAANLPVSGTPSNSSLSSCPRTSGSGCSLGNEQLLLSSQLAPPFAPNAAAAPGTTGAYPPAAELAPLGLGLPNQNPSRGAGSGADRANENSCKSVVDAYVTCPGAITPGAVELYYTAGSCITNGNGGDTYVFSGYQYDWVSVYEPSSNTCTNTLGASDNTAYIGLFYTPGATIAVTSPYVAEAAGTGGFIGGAFTFTGTLPKMAYSSSYAPVPPASRLIS